MSPAGPLISCIIPTLNRGRVLVDTLEQLVAQKPQAPEIIVVDQTPKVDPATEAALSAWRDQGVIQWIRQVEPNASKARNTGALAASGEILLFLDDDIQVAPDFAEAHANNYRDPKVLAVAGQVLETERTTTTQLQYPADDSDVGWIYFPKNYAARCQTSWMASGNFSIKRDLYFEIGGMDENYERGAFREESDFAMRFLARGHRFQFDPASSITHLGVEGAPLGGSRSWIRNKRIAGWHHCVGDWYFNVHFISWKNWNDLLFMSFRHFVLNRYNVSRPWLVPTLLFRWMLALPIAISRRLAGARLIVMGSAARC